MKLTTARLKKLIHEEIQKLNEAIPTGFVRKGTIRYNNDKMMYYVFEKGTYDSEDVEGLSQSPRFGHYRVNDKKAGKKITGALYLQIDQIVQNDPQLDGSYDYVVGVTKEKVYQKLLANDDILEDENKR
jgi:hypothetical protein